jgi:hypothetical protein
MIGDNINKPRQDGSSYPLQIALCAADVAERRRFDPCDMTEVKSVLYLMMFFFIHSL